MVVITVKLSASHAKPEIKECRTYPNSAFDEVPDFVELETWVAGLLARAGYDTPSFQLLLDGTALTMANTTERMSGMVHAVVNIHCAYAPTRGTSPSSRCAGQVRSVRELVADTSPGANPAVALPVGGSPEEQLLLNNYGANKESHIIARRSGPASATREGSGQDSGSAESCCVLLRESVSMRVTLERSVQMIACRGNALIALAQWALQEWTEVNKAVSQLKACGHVEDAQELLQKARTTYDCGLSQCGLFRLNSQNVARKLKAFCQAVDAGDSAAAKRHILSAHDLSSQLVSQCEEVRTKIEGILQELREEVKRCAQACGAAQASRNLWRVVATTSGLGGCRATARACLSGLTATVSSGFLGLGSANVWNLAGLACCGVAAALAGASVAVGIVAVRKGALARQASEQMEAAERVRKMTEEVKMATEVCTHLWKFMATIGLDIQNSLDQDMLHLSDHDRHMLRQELHAALKQLKNLLDLQDECLVWMTETAVYQLPFDVRTEIGQDRYEALKALRKAGEAAQPQGNRSG